MRKVHIEYFALLSQEAGKEAEEFSTEASTIEELLTELYTLYRFSLPKEMIKTALNQQIVSWNAPLIEGDEVMLLTPLAGG